MAKVRDVAQIVAPKGTSRNAGDLENSAFLVWNAARRDRDRIRSDHYRNGVKGWNFEGNLTRVILSLWPEFAPKSKKEKLEQFRADVYQFLAQSGNAICTRRGPAEDVRWWIRDEWKKPNSVTLTRLIQTSAERRLTPQEAGEDREPAPVTVTTTKETKITTTATVNRADRLRDFHEKQAEEKRARREMTVELLDRESEGQPLTVNEVAAALDVHMSTARTMLAEMVDEGLVFSREETPDEHKLRRGGHARARRSLLFSTSDPVPPRTVQHVDGAKVEQPAPVKREQLPVPTPLGAMPVRDQIIALLDQLTESQVDPRLDELERENAELRQRVAELEAAIEPLKAFLK